MHHHVRSLVLFIAVVGLTVGAALAAEARPGEGSWFRSAFPRLRAGMTPAEVTAEMGRPAGDYRTAGGGPAPADNQAKWADDQVIVVVTFGPDGTGLTNKSLVDNVAPPPTAWDRLTYRLEKRGLRLPRV